MRIAIPDRQGRVSPVFDVAGRLLLVDIQNDAEWRTQCVALASQDPFERAREVLRLGTEVLICGAVSLPLEAALNGSGIQVFSFVCGEVKEIVEAFLSGTLSDPRFLMPGCCSRRRRCRLSAGWRRKDEADDGAGTS